VNSTVQTAARHLNLQQTGSLSSISSSLRLVMKTASVCFGLVESLVASSNESFNLVSEEMKNFELHSSGLKKDG